jgi:hypothetical protein
LTVDVTPQLGAPTSFIVPLTLLAVPILDTTTVSLGRMRRRRRLSVGGKDHLSHRLVARGLSKGQAVGVLLLAQAALSVIGVLIGRRVIPTTSGVILAATVIAALGVYAVPAKVYRQAPRGLPASVRLGIFAVVLAVPGAAAPAVTALLRVADPARQAAAAAERALDALSVGDAEQAAADVRAAASAFTSVEETLNGPLTSLGLGVPAVSSNLNAARVLVSAGRALSEAGLRVVTVADAAHLPVHRGTVSLDELTRMAPILAGTHQVLRESQEALSVLERGFLAAPLSDAIEDLKTRLAKQEPSMQRAALAARLLPDLLGRTGPRHYFLAFQNNAELRGTGGLIGNWGELVAENGNLRLERFGRLKELNERATRLPPEVLPTGFVNRWGELGADSQWQQINVSPDFPTTARVISAQYEEAGGQAVDGVIAIDPPGLAALLELTGPISVEGWPEPITAENVVHVTLRDAYIRYPVEQDAARIQFLDNLARGVTEAFTTADLGSPVRVASAFGKAVGGGHLMVYLANPDEQRLAVALGAHGQVPPLQGDSLMVVNQNVAANKLDSFLQRNITYNVQLDPSRSPAALSGQISITLENQVPDGLPSSIIGPYTDAFQPGENRSYVSVYSPFKTSVVKVDGAPVEAKAQHELGRRVQSTVVSMSPQESRTITLDVEGKLDLSRDGWYRLDLPRQPTLNADSVEIRRNGERVR